MVETIKTAIGLMSGTSLDGIDAAIIVTDGKRVYEIKDSLSYVYSDDVRQRIRDAIVGIGDVELLGDEIAVLHAGVVKDLLGVAGLQAGDVDVIGFHGQTIWHDPDAGRTVQIGNGKLLAKLTGIVVVNDFRVNDVKHGGQGAPLVPLYHAALVSGQELPVAIVNIGGVSNVTWVGPGVDNLVAFDTGPGNALVDDWVLEHCGLAYDGGGSMASKGKVHEDVLEVLLGGDYFRQVPPKSLDRNAFKVEMLSGLSVEDGAATLTEFTVRSIVLAGRYFDSDPVVWYVTGGGRHNNYIMRRLQDVLSVTVVKIENMGYNGDMLEAEAFGFLAVRSLYGLPLTLPVTTGVKMAVSGGVMCNG